MSMYYYSLTRFASKRRKPCEIALEKSPSRISPRVSSRKALRHGGKYELLSLLRKKNERPGDILPAMWEKAFPEVRRARGSRKYAEKARGSRKYAEKARGSRKYAEKAGESRKCAERA